MWGREDFWKKFGNFLRNPKPQCPNPNQTPNPKSQTPKTIVSVGRLVPWKGFNVLVEIMQELPEWKLVIIGDGPEYNNLKSQISLLRQGFEGQANYKLQNQITLTGAISRESVLEYLRTSEVFVLNTSFESFSYQIVEAMAVGIPIVATSIGNISEIVRDGVDGILVEPNNKKSIINAIKKISDNPEFRSSIIESAMQRSKEFSIEKTLNNLVLILKK